MVFPSLSLCPCFRTFPAVPLLPYPYCRTLTAVPSLFNNSTILTVSLVEIKSFERPSSWNYSPSNRLPHKISVLRTAFLVEFQSFIQPRSWNSSRIHTEGYFSWSALSDGNFTPFHYSTKTCRVRSWYFFPGTKKTGPLKKAKACIKFVNMNITKWWNKCGLSNSRKWTR